MAKEVKYQPCDWLQYNKNLIKRGRLTLGFDLEDIQKWYNLNMNIQGLGN